MPTILTPLTNGERLVIDRRRRDENQREAAARHDVPPSVYQGWELDAEGRRCPTAVPIGRLAPNERCFLYRRQAKRTRQWMADQLQMSKRWITLMERGEQDCSRLAAFWEK